MRKFIFAVIMTIISVTSATLAQDDQLENLQFETEDAQPESSSYFAVGAGYTATYNLLNLDDLNKLATGKFNLPELKSPFFSTGFEIFTGSIIVKNLNVGFFSYSGTSSSKLDSTGINRTFDYQIYNQGLIVDYGFVLYKAFAILPGFQLGFANSEININQTLKKVDWGNIDGKNTIEGYTHNLKKSFLNLEPRISLQYAVTNFLMFRANASYAISVKNPFVKEDWVYNNSAEALNVPDGINQSGFKIQLGLFVGLMNF
jgi:hypothetical protein